MLDHSHGHSIFHRCNAPPQWVAATAVRIVNIDCRITFLMTDVDSAPKTHGLSRPGESAVFPAIGQQRGWLREMPQNSRPSTSSERRERVGMTVCLSPSHWTHMGGRETDNMERGSVSGPKPHCAPTRFHQSKNPAGGATGKMALPGRRQNSDWLESRKVISFSKTSKVTPVKKEGTVIYAARKSRPYIR